MENRIKEQQLCLFADRTSCHRWWPNQFRLLLSSLAYVLVDEIRSRALRGTRLARAQAGTIRLRMLKIGAVSARSTRSVWLRLSGSCPPEDRRLFVPAVARLKPGGPAPAFPASCFLRSAARRTVPLAPAPAVSSPAPGFRPETPPRALRKAVRAPAGGPRAARKAETAPS